MFAHALEWIFKTKFHVKHVLHYLDDWCLIEQTNDLCFKNLSKFQELCQMVGVPLAKEKTHGPARQMTFLGIKLDSVAFLASLPPDKLEVYTAQLCDSDQTTLQDMRALAGRLNWALSVVLPGRAFLRRLYEAMGALTNPRAVILITPEIKADLDIWYRFLRQYNGKFFIQYIPVLDSHMLNLYADASFQAGAAVFGSSWIRIPYPDNWKDLGIVFLELYPIVVMAHMIAPQIANSKIIFHTDNITVMHILNSHTSKSPLIMDLIRPLVLLSLSYNFTITSLHVKGSLNVIPDVLSHFQEDRLFLLNHGLEVDPLLLNSAWHPKTWMTHKGTC